MGNLIRKQNFRCYDDCIMSGCKGHTLQVNVQTTADIMEVLIDGETLFTTDPSKWEALLKAVDSLDYSSFEVKK